MIHTYTDTYTYVRTYVTSYLHTRVCVCVYLSLWKLWTSQQYTHQLVRIFMNNAEYANILCLCI